MRIGIIINPRSGNGRGANVWHVVKEELIRRNIVYWEKTTTRPGEAPFLVRSFLAEHALNVIIAIGGDGTVSEVADGIVRCGEKGRKVRLAAIPAGTGNDFAKGHDIPVDTLKALHRILDVTEHHPDPIDLLHAVRNSASLAIDTEIADRYAVNCIGAGFDGEVAMRTNRSPLKKRLNRVGLGSLSYFFIALSVFFSYKPSSAKITVDDRTYIFENLWLVAVMNIPYFGGSMHICPGADPRDGQADVVAVRGKSRWKLLPILLSIFKGTHVGHPAVTFLRGSSIRIEADLPLHAHADGESLGTAPLDIHLLPARLQVK